MLPNVKQKTIKPIIEAMVVKGTMIYTDEYSIYARLPVWGYQHKTVCHSRGEYARDEDGDGFHEVSTRSTSIRWKDFGRCCAPGYGLIAVSRKRNSPSISGSFSSSIIHAGGEKLFLAHWSAHWSPNTRSSTLKPRMSQPLMPATASLRS